MVQSLVSVVIPFYKGKTWLAEALESVVNQTYKKIEIILVNDGSKEDITSILKKYQEKIKYIHQENKGAAAARNLGISACKGKYIAFLDSDDLWLPRKLEVQINMMEKENSSWSHTCYMKFDEQSNVKKIDTSDFGGKVFPLILTSNHIATPTVVIRRKVFLESSAYRFEESMKFGEDTVLWAMLSTNYELLPIGEELVKVRLHGNNSAIKATSQIKARADIWDFMKNQPLFSMHDKLPVASTLAYKYCNYIAAKFPFLENETMARFFYLVPWSFFKLDKFILRTKR